MMSRRIVCYDPGMRGEDVRPPLTVLVTGASGFVGGSVAAAALAAGYRVVGVARSERAAAILHDRGIEVLRGDLQAPVTFREMVVGADVVIHAGFARDAYVNLDAAVAVEERATAALVSACAASGSRLVYTSGIGVLGPTGSAPADEDCSEPTPTAMRWRRNLERLVLDGDGVVIRPAFVYGRAGGDILRSLIEAAVERGEARYPGPGDRPWPSVHVDDLADAYLRATTGPGGMVFNVAGGEASPRAVVEAIGRLVGVPARAVSVDEAAQTVPYASWLSGPGIRVDSRRARRVLGWSPTGTDLLDDIEHGSYCALVAPVGGRVGARMRRSP
jgi:nucleoside-diphosphate-sugar epimerase